MSKKDKAPKLAKGDKWLKVPQSDIDAHNASVDAIGGSMPLTRESISGSCTVSELQDIGYLDTAFGRTIAEAGLAARVSWEAMTKTFDRETANSKEEAAKTCIAYELLLVHLANALSFVDHMRQAGIDKMRTLVNVGHITRIAIDQEGRMFVGTENIIPDALGEAPKKKAEETNVEKA